jgi:hypothetical protein
VGGEAGRVGGLELIEQEGVDERSGACAIQGVRVRHILYMT